MLLTAKLKTGVTLVRAQRSEGGDNILDTGRCLSLPITEAQSVPNSRSAETATRNRVLQIAFSVNGLLGVCALKRVEEAKPGEAEACRAGTVDTQ